MKSFREKVDEQFVSVEEFKEEWARRTLTIDIARQIVNLRYRNRWSQKDVANRLGVSKETVDQIMKLEPLSKEKLNQIADKLNQIAR